MKIISLPVNFGSQASVNAEGLVKRGLECDTAHSEILFSLYKPTYSLSKNRLVSYLQRIFFTILFSFKYDVFLYHAGSSLFTLKLNFLDVRLNKILRKKVIPVFHGSELRMPSIEKKRNPFYLNTAYNESDTLARIRLSKWSKISDTVITCDCAFLNYGLEKYFKNIHHLPLAIELDRLKPRRLENEKVVIMHAPSHIDAKGTKWIRESISDLKNLDYDFEYIEITGRSHQDLLKLINKADIVIDQMMLGNYGVFALEAMALEKPVICYIQPEVLEYLPADLPIINSTPETLLITLKQLFSQTDTERRKIGKLSREYVRKYHDYNYIAEKLERIINQNKRT